MTRQTVDIKWVDIVLFKRTWLNIQITKEKQDHDLNAGLLLRLLAKRSKLNKLPKNIRDIHDAMSTSYHNTAIAFATRSTTVHVVNVSDLVDQLL